MMPRKSPISVLYVDNSFTFGGAINALDHLLTAMDARVVRPFVLSAQTEAFLAEHFPDVPTQAWDVQLPWIHGPIHRRVTRWPVFSQGPLRTIWDKGRAAWWLTVHDLPDAIRIARVARGHDADLIHLNTGLVGMLPGLLAGKLLGLPVVAHARGPQEMGVLRFFAGMVDRWIAVSGVLAQDLEEAGVQGGRITVIHDALDLSRFSPGARPPALGAELRIPVDAPVFGVFGRVIPWKGIREFVEGAARVMDEVPAAHALVVGDRSDGSEDYHRDVVELTRDLGIADRVHFTGFRTDVCDLMRLCDVVVHTSIVPEPFGMIVIEAMATSTPVVAADAGGPTEILTSGEHGYLVDPADPERLGEAITRLLRDPTLAERMGARGEERVQEHYSAERYARDVTLVYEELLARGSTSP